MHNNFSFSLMHTLACSVAVSMLRIKGNFSVYFLVYSYPLVRTFITFSQSSDSCTLQLIKVLFHICFLFYSNVLIMHKHFASRFLHSIQNGRKDNWFQV